MSEFLAEARILVRPDTTGFRAELITAVTAASRGVTVPVTIVKSGSERSAALLYGWALWNYLHNRAADRSDPLFTICGGVYFDQMSALTPSGGCYGWVLNIRGEIEGFNGVPT